MTALFATAAVSAETYAAGSVPSVSAISNWFGSCCSASPAMPLWFMISAGSPSRLKASPTMWTRRCPRAVMRVIVSPTVVPVSRSMREVATASSVAVYQRPVISG